MICGSVQKASAGRSRKAGVLFDPTPPVPLIDQWNDDADVLLARDLYELIQRTIRGFVELPGTKDEDVVRHVRAGTGYAQDIAPDDGSAHLVDGVQGVMDFVPVGPTPGRRCPRREIVFHGVEVGNIERNEAKLAVTCKKSTGLPLHKVRPRRFFRRADPPAERQRQGVPRCTCRMV